MTIRKYREAGKTEGMGNKVFVILVASPGDTQVRIEESIKETRRSPAKSFAGDSFYVLKCPRIVPVADGYLIPERRLVRL